MSVLICSLCEQNRTAITSAVREAMQALGTHATGLAPFLSKLICQECNSTKKHFDFKHWLNTEDIVSFEIESDEKGYYSIHLKHPLHQFPDINFISIINRIKSQIDHLDTEHEIDHAFYKFDGTPDPDKFWVWIKNTGNLVLCECGSKSFQPLV